MDLRPKIAKDIVASLEQELFSGRGFHEETWMSIALSHLQSKAISCPPDGAEMAQAAAVQLFLQKYPHVQRAMDDVRDKAIELFQPHFANLSFRSVLASDPEGCGVCHEKQGIRFLVTASVPLSDTSFGEIEERFDDWIVQGHSCELLFVTFDYDIGAP